MRQTPIFRAFLQIAIYGAPSRSLLFPEISQITGSLLFDMALSSSKWLRCGNLWFPAVFFGSALDRNGRSRYLTAPFYRVFEKSSREVYRLRVRGQIVCRRGVTWYREQQTVNRLAC